MLVLSLNWETIASDACFEDELVFSLNKRKNKLLCRRQRYKTEEKILFVFDTISKSYWYSSALLFQVILVLLCCLRRFEEKNFLLSVVLWKSKTTLRALKHLFYAITSILKVHRDLLVIRLGDLRWFVSELFDSICCFMRVISYAFSLKIASKKALTLRETFDKELLRSFWRLFEKRQEKKGFFFVREKFKLWKLILSHNLQFISLKRKVCEWLKISFVI